MRRRGFLRLASGVVVAATAPALVPDEARRRFWQGWRAPKPEYVTVGFDVKQPDPVARWEAWVDETAAALKEPWGQPWTDKGYTRDGLHVRAGRVEYVDIKVDQMEDPVLRMPMKMEMPLGVAVRHVVISGTEFRPGEVILLSQVDPADVGKAIDAGLVATRGLVRAPVLTLA